MFVLLLACVTESPMVGLTTSDGGGWELALDAVTYDQGASDVVVTVTPLDAATATGLTLFLRPDMEDMTHTRDVVHFDEREQGVYSAEMVLDMSGLWTLTGYVGEPERMEAITFIVEALS